MAATKITNRQLSITTNLDVASHKITNVTDPTAEQDAATKAYVDAAIAGVGGGTVVIRETPSGTIDGTNTDFVLANEPLSGTEEVYLNGLLQDSGAGNDYTISTDTITFLTAPSTGDKIRVSYTY